MCNEAECMMMFPNLQQLWVSCNIKCTLLNLRVSIITPTSKVGSLSVQISYPTQPPITQKLPLVTDFRLCLNGKKNLNKYLSRAKKLNFRTKVNLFPPLSRHKISCFLILEYWFLAHCKEKLIPKLRINGPKFLDCQNSI